MKRNKTKTFLNIIIVIFSLLFLCGCKQGLQQSSHRLILNDDGNGLLACASVEEINAYIDDYAQTRVTTLMVCSGSDFFHYRSRYGKVFGEEENYLKLEEEGTDMITASINRAQEKGMEAFVTFRVNDLHFTDTTETGYPANAVSPFWLEHPEYRTNENIGWHSAGAFDFSHKEVRDYKLGVITEQLEKYGGTIDGYDLDFMRFIVYFKSDEGVKNAPLMTDFVKSVRAEIDKQSKKYGKKILLSARVPTTLKDCLYKGLDVKEWLNLGLLDFISIGVHFNGNPAMPVRKFISDINNFEIPVYASIEDGEHVPREFYSHGMYRGMASHILTQGGDGIYLFNYFFRDDSYKHNRQVHLEEGGQICKVKTHFLLDEISSLETLHKRNKIYSLDEGSVQYGLRQDTPLPLNVTGENETDATIYIGDDPVKDKPIEAILFIRTDRPVQCLLRVNGEKVENQKPEYVSLYQRGNNLMKGEKVYAYTLPVPCLIQGNNQIRFKSNTNESFIVKRIEIALKYGAVDEFGYF